jgi:predicted ATPase
VDFLGRQVVDALVQDHVGRRKRDASELVSGVNQWLEHLARVKLELSEVSKSQKLWEVRLRDTASGRFSNFADVGFGVGQALPVLVEGLRTPTGGVFLVQEPEIHLHPDAQLAMGDFLVDLACSGRQVIVETHSEHILLRVRRRLAEGTNNGLTPDDVSVLHVGWDDIHKSSTLTPLTIDQLGQVQNWPRGFFEEANVERLTLLQTMAAKAGKAAT